MFTPEHSHVSCYCCEPLKPLKWTKCGGLVLLKRIEGKTQWGWRGQGCVVLLLSPAVCVCVCVWVSLCVRGNYSGMCGPVSLSGCVCVCVCVCGGGGGGGGGGCLFVSEVITVGCVGEGTYSSCSAVWDRLITTKHYFSATFCCFPCISWAFFNFVLGFVLNLSLSSSSLSKRDPVFSRNQ